jgi:hypothetical protein
VQAHEFLEGFLPLQNPPNYQLVCDELSRLYAFTRARSTVEAYVKKHLPHLIPTTPKKPRIFRRFRRAKVGELWQHDSSIHQWWPDSSKQTLLLTVDDCSGANVAGSFVPSDTTWAHFQHFRKAFELHGIPEAIYTDALSLFGPSSSGDRRDPRSEFQRALRALDIAHLVAPTPQAKGKIERRFGTFQGRLLTLLAHAGVTSYLQAEPILQMEIARLNQAHSRSTGQIPDLICQQAQIKNLLALRPCPPSSLLDLHLSLRCTRKVNNDHTIEFDGRSFQIAPTLRKFVHIVFHPNLRFWALDGPPTLRWSPVLGAFTL